MVMHNCLEKEMEIKRLKYQVRYYKQKCKEKDLKIETLKWKIESLEIKRNENYDFDYPFPDKGIKHNVGY